MTMGRRGNSELGHQCTVARLYWVIYSKMWRPSRVGARPGAERGPIVGLEVPVGTPPESAVRGDHTKKPCFQ